MQRVFPNDDAAPFTGALRPSIEHRNK